MPEEPECEELEYYVSCGNVFADLGLPDAEELQLKSQLSIEIRRALKAKRLSRQQAAHKIGISKEELIRLLDGTPFHLSVMQLTGYLGCLGYDVQLFATVRKRTAKADKPRKQKAREAVAA